MTDWMFMGRCRLLLRFIRLIVLMSALDGRADESPTVEDIRDRMESVGIRSVRSADGHLVVSGPDSFDNAMLLNLAGEVRVQVESLVGMPMRWESRSIRLLVVPDTDTSAGVRVEHTCCDGMRIHRVLLPGYAHVDADAGREALCGAFLALFIYPAETEAGKEASFAVPAWLRRGIPPVLTEQGRADTFEQAMRLWREGRLVSPARIVTDPAVLDAEGDRARITVACGAFVLWLTDEAAGTAHIGSLMNRLSNGGVADEEWLRQRLAGEGDTDAWWDRWILSQRHVVRALGRLSLLHLEALQAEWRLYAGADGVPSGVALPSDADCTALLLYRDQPWFKTAIRGKRYRIELLALGRPVPFRELVAVYTGTLDAIESGATPVSVAGMAVSARRQSKALYETVKQAGGSWSEP